MKKEEQIVAKNKQYWDEHADLWFGTTSLPKYGVKFVTEDDLHFFSDVTGKKVLELCCGSGRSLIWSHLRSVINAESFKHLMDMRINLERTAKTRENPDFAVPRRHTKICKIIARKKNGKTL